MRAEELEARAELEGVVERSSACDRDILSREHVPHIRAKGGLKQAVRHQVETHSRGRESLLGYGAAATGVDHFAGVWLGA